jgi:hypothetical protein
MKQQYRDVNFRPHSLRMIDDINDIIDEYQAAGYTLTVRQLYYQLVARDIIENTMKSYKSAASLINDARIAGLIDWDAIEDRTREFITRNRWNSGREILMGCAQQFHMDMWHNQDRRVFVIVEKEALVGILQPVCREFDVPLLAARGYPSASVVREFAESVVRPALIDEQQNVLVLHLGDHDPSGIDMSRDLLERIEMFTGNCDGGDVELRRIALNMPQVEELNPPPNPAKTTDARFAAYKKKFGSASWELDALPPEYIDSLIREHVTAEIDDDTWDRREKEILAVRKKIQKVADSF